MIKLMKKTLFAVLVCTLMTLTLTGCGSKVETDNRVGNVSIEKLNDINNKIIYYFNDNGTSIYNNYSYNYVDEKDMVVVVGLVNNSKEEQEKFIKKVFIDDEAKILDAINNQEIIKFVESKDAFEGKIIVAEENYITVEVSRDSKSFKVKDKVTMKISRPTNGTNDYYAVNNKVRVTFSGLIEDSNPPQINAVNIELIS